MADLPSSPGSAPPASAAPPPAAPPAATTAPAPVTPSYPAAGGGDWAATITDSIDRYVGLVRDRTTRPALLATRGLVFGIMLLLLGITAVVLVSIAWTTLITALVGEVWITDFITGGIFVVLGAFLMSRRRPPEVEL